MTSDPELPRSLGPDPAPLVCEECGDDEATEGHRFCTDCLEAGAEETA